jgi:hypothetical protein
MTFAHLWHFSHYQESFHKFDFRQNTAIPFDGTPSSPLRHGTPSARSGPEKGVLILRTTG